MKLGKGLKEQPVILIEPAFPARYDREAVARVLFEELGVPSVLLVNTAVAAMYANNMTTGLVLCSGGELRSENTVVTHVLFCFTHPDVVVHVPAQSHQATLSLCLKGTANAIV